tara:strand:- start:1072 stop:1242 length:171 start_codon:yes stop_codon:yes gene_type:complete
VKPKICKECGIKLDNENGYRVGGYLVRLCKKCRKKFHNERNVEIRKKLKQFKDWYG